MERPALENMDDSTTPDRRSRLYRIAARLIRHTISREDVATRFSVELDADESIFDALRRHQIASDHYSAIRTIGHNFPPPTGGTWRDLALWVLDYENAERGR